MASATCVAMASRRFSGSPPRGTTLASVRPSTSSIAMNGRPPIGLDGVDGDDGGMVQRGEGACLAFEAGAAIL